MKYPEKLLYEDERVVFDVHHSPVVLWRPLLLLIVYPAAWIAALVFLNTFRRGWLLVAGLVILVLLVAFFAWKIAVWTHVNLVLTDHRLIYRGGVVARKSREIPLSQINDVSFVESIIGRVFGIGDLVVEPAGEQGLVPFILLRRPDELKLKILERVRAGVREPSGKDGRAIAEEVARVLKKEQPTQELITLPRERPPLYSEIVDQIERLDKLRERGSITDEEFREAKKSLLGRLEDEPE